MKESYWKAMKQAPRGTLSAGGDFNLTNINKNSNYRQLI